MRSLRLIMLFWRQSLLRQMIYPQSFWFLFFVQVGGFFAQWLGIEIVFAQTETLAGWSKGSALVLLAIFGITSSILRLLFESSFLYFCRDVRQGTFDMHLVRPVDVRLPISFRSVMWEQIGSVLFSIVLLFVVIARGMVTVSPPLVAGFLLLGALGLFIGYHLWFALTTLIFFASTIEHFGYLYGVVLSVVRYPLAIYGRVGRRALLTILPIGFIASVPAEFLLGKGVWSGIGVSAAVAVVVFFLTQLWWRFALRHYASASS